MVKRFPLTLHFFLVTILLFTSVFLAYAEVIDPLDPFSMPFEISTDEESDKSKSAQELIGEAEILLDGERLIDARTKLLRALQKDPKSYRAHMLLAGYYMVNVGHFRLSLKYVLQAMKLFEEVEGKPPYTDLKKRTIHGQLLYLLSQARLNLDNYSGALQVLDQFVSYGYYAAWYPGTRSWILMKLGRIDEAIKVARIGILAGAEPGRTLNMLGILLSMHGEREESLKVFREALAYELSQGKLGQPATPLNNAGEVYKETFLDEKAESSWLRATNMPDGCEHVLPALNLSLLYLDEINTAGATQAMDNFEACIAQFPLRNGEEHKALVHLARGRIALIEGYVDAAIQHYESALEDRQWFGKIGTSENDLKAAALTSLGQAYRAKVAHLKTTVPGSVLARFDLLEQIAEARLYQWWYFRSARKTLTEDLSDLEDLFIRNTDSLLEYPTLGELLSGFYKVPLVYKIDQESRGDKRQNALLYYRAYLAEHELVHGDKKKALSEITNLSETVRPKFDDLLMTHLLGRTLSYLDPNEADYAAISERLFNLSRPALRNYGAKLVVNLAGDQSLRKVINQGCFIVDNQTTRAYSIQASKEGSQSTLFFYAPAAQGGSTKVAGTDAAQLVNKLCDAVFSAG